MDEHMLNDLLECSVCLERLDTTAKVLPCQHTFCRKCLEVIVASHKELRCPECRILVQLKIDDLPTNVLLMRILEGIKNAAATSGKQTQCEEQTKSVEIQRQIQIKTSESPKHLQKQHLNNQTQSSTQQTRRVLPHAYALYDFGSAETTDLNFKKGDLILLKRRVDSNWFVGQSNGKEGTFPVNYVQVIVPLPTPQCIALYDFKMVPNEEEGCLTFKKGAIIHVLRRVDQNWAEGRIGNSIGIFPIAFVELNSLAKQLLETQYAQLMTNNAQQQESAKNIPPPVPQLELTESSSSSASTSTSTSTSASTSHTNSALNSSSSASSSSNCSPNQSCTSTPFHKVSTGHSSVRYRDKNAKEKRHSLNALLMASANGCPPSLSMIQSNRHSAEILSLPHELNIAAPAPTTAAATNANTENSLSEFRQLSPTMQPTAQQLSNSTGTLAAHTTRVLKTSVPQHTPPSLPWGYLALYPYKPRNNDELELKKGCVYIVNERCLDGWFKGKNWQDVTGVFPGNYVTPLRPRDQQQLMHQWKFVPQTLHEPSIESSTTTTTESLNKRLSNLLPHQPPDLPPRQTATQSCTTTTCSVWTKPLGLSVETFFNRNKANETKDKDKDKEKEKDKDANCTGGGAVSLMKRLTHMKSRSKSPGTKVAEAELKNVIEKNNANTEQLQAVHVRSGSCPSQLLQSFPNATNPQRSIEPLHAPQVAQNITTTTTSNANCGSQRIKNNKERPNLLCARQSLDASLFRDMYSGNNSNRTNLTTAAAAATSTDILYAQLPKQHTNLIIAPNHRKTQSLDAGNLLNNPSSGGGVAPLPCNITEAAIKASATTKSTQCTRESRFRCVVPYPPNSDIELELHVGDIIFVQRKQKNGWYKGTHARTNQTGLFPASFVEPDI